MADRHVDPCVLRHQMPALLDEICTVTETKQTAIAFILASTCASFAACFHDVVVVCHSTTKSCGSMMHKDQNALSAVRWS